MGSRFTLIWFPCRLNCGCAILEPRLPITRPLCSCIHSTSVLPRRMLAIFIYLILSFLASPSGTSSPVFVNQQPEAPNPPHSKHRELEWGSINFLHTTDVHVFILCSKVPTNARVGLKAISRNLHFPQTGEISTPLSII